jgi:hypothetical protein
VHYRVAAGDLRDTQRAIAGFIDLLDRASRHNTLHSTETWAATRRHYRRADRSSDLVGGAGAFKTIEAATRDREFLAPNPCDLIGGVAKGLQQHVADTANDIVTGLAERSSPGCPAWQTQLRVSGICCDHRGYRHISAIDVTPTLLGRSPARADRGRNRPRTPRR